MDIRVWNMKPGRKALKWQDIGSPTGNGFPATRKHNVCFNKWPPFPRKSLNRHSKAAGGPTSYFESIGNIEGYPVLTKIFSEGKIVTESRLTGVEGKRVSAEKFDPPKDSLKKDFLPKQKPAHPAP